MLHWKIFFSCSVPECQPKFVLYLILLVTFKNNRNSIFPQADYECDHEWDHLFSYYFIAYLHVASKLYPLSVQIRAMYLVRSRPAKSTRCMA